MREAPSIQVVNELVKAGAIVYAYDPIAVGNAKKMLGESLGYVEKIEEAIENAHAALILTEWDEIKNVDLSIFKSMKTPLVIDGRNCFELKEVNRYPVEYHSIGRSALYPTKHEFSVY